MSNMLSTIVPKSDQLNADDLIGGQTLTIKVTKVSVKTGDQPVSIYYEGDKGKPYKPSMSMRRVLVHAWGGDANHYVGKSIRLYRDPAVKWAGEAVGGICISHLSDIDRPFVIPLTVTRGNKKQHRVEVLATEQLPDPAPSVAEYDACRDLEAFDSLESRRKAQWPHLGRNERQALKEASEAAHKRLTQQPAAAQPNDSPVDLAALFAQLEHPADAAALKATWTVVCNHFADKGEEVPLKFEATYQISKEQFA